jgi:hypothetical protein
VSVQGSPAEVQLGTHWNLIGRSMIALPPVLSRSSYSSYTLGSLRFHFHKGEKLLRISKLLFLWFLKISYFSNGVTCNCVS